MIPCGGAFTFVDGNLSVADIPEEHEEIHAFFISPDARSTSIPSYLFRLALQLSFLTGSVLGWNVCTENTRNKKEAVHS